MLAGSSEQNPLSSFQIDLPGGRLLHGSKPIDIRPKALAVLKYLADHSGQLVTKQQILQAVWPDVHVDDAVLKVTIREIRKALDDPSREPRFIETAHRQGYRFIGSIGQRQGAGAGIAVAPDAPETRYAKSGDVSIAYQVLGEGPPDLVFVMGWVSHLEYFWTEPSFAAFLRRLASFSRLILFDKRGTGLSDRVPPAQLPTLEERMDDMRAVMDAVGSERAVLCGVSEGAAMSALFAATYPQKTAALVMIGPYAKRIRGAGYPWGPTEAERERFLEDIRNEWGGPVGLEERAPSLAADLEFRRWWATYLRMSASPTAAVALTRMNSEADIRSILPNIAVPTLVLHRTGDQCLNVEEGRYVASRIPGAKFIELPGVDHLPFVGDRDAVLNQIETFLMGGMGRTPGSNEMLATVVSAHFEAMHGERARLARRLQNHIRQEVERFKGRRFRSARNRMLACFDGPARAIRCACAIAKHASWLGLEAKFGLHIGECSLKQRGLSGCAVEVARRIEERAQPGEILASAAIRNVVAGSEIRFERRGLLEGSELEVVSVLQSGRE
jgi:pimeloyl-ACP methyl ester carboxylesterase/DNA-binding winged helix-turn-helix (wHTH) protein